MDFNSWLYGDQCVKKYDPQCKKCGTLISFSEGIGDCPRCYGKGPLDLIDLHVTQAAEYRKRRNMGLVFLIASLLAGAITLLLLAT